MSLTPIDFIVSAYNYVATPDMTALPGEDEIRPGTDFVLVDDARKEGPDAVSQLLVTNPHLAGLMTEQELAKNGF